MRRRQRKWLARMVLVAQVALVEVDQIRLLRRSGLAWASFFSAWPTCTKC